MATKVLVTELLAHVQLVITVLAMLRYIEYGDCDVVLAGGAEASICGTGVAGFNSLKALSTRNDDPKLPHALGIKIAMVLSWVKVPLYWF